MGILGRLGKVVKSYLNEESGTAFGGGGREGNFRDSDLNAAYEELEGFLRGEKQKPPPKKEPQIPAELRADFAELGLSPSANAAECKAAYKKLLKKHHPDHHSADPKAMKNATEKTARVNASYRRIEAWFKQG